MQSNTKNIWADYWLMLRKLKFLLDKESAFIIILQNTQV